MSLLDLSTVHVAEETPEAEGSRTDLSAYRTSPRRDGYDEEASTPNPEGGLHETSRNLGNSRFTDELRPAWNVGCQSGSA